MSQAVVIVDTNVVVSGLLTRDPNSPPAAILDAMLDGSLRFIVSDALVAEYVAVLSRPAIARLHRLSAGEIDRIVRAIVLSARFVTPDAATDSAPDRGDQHLWDLLDSVPGALLVTGDAVLRRSRRHARVLSPAEFLESRRKAE
ncbi:MAG: putative toxin-antitoxin system toxin component, PIN family [Acidobacteria bacterium]|nr:putative toxin-antitoxin system toxin component, PIN family [Acidobacteriota bacterium]